ASPPPRRGHGLCRRVPGLDRALRWPGAPRPHHEAPHPERRRRPLGGPARKSCCAVCLGIGPDEAGSAWGNALVAALPIDDVAQRPALEIGAQVCTEDIDGAVAFRIAYA